MAAYTTDGIAPALPNRTGVVKHTRSVLRSKTWSKGSSSESGRSNEEELGLGSEIGLTIPAPPQGGAPWIWTSNNPVNVGIEEGTSSESSKSEDFAKEHQTIVNTDYGYRTPYMETQAQNHRAQISLIDQAFAQFMYGQNLPYLIQVFQNEKNSIDGDVYRLQIAYLNTILMSPIFGTVTGIYKNPGDAVRAGEPVIRVENNRVVLLVATLIYRGPIGVGPGVIVTLQTKLFGLPGPRTTVSGSVVAARVLREDDHWEVIVQCDNPLDASGNPILPLGYHFDYDDTTVSIT